MAASGGYYAGLAEPSSDSEDRHNYEDLLGEDEGVEPDAEIAKRKIVTPERLTARRTRRRAPASAEPDSSYGEVYVPEPDAPPPGVWAHIQAPEPPPKPRYERRYIPNEGGVGGRWEEVLLPEDQWIPADPRKIKYKHVPPNQHSEAVRKFIEATAENVPAHWLERDPTHANYRPQIVVGGTMAGMPLGRAHAVQPMPSPSTPSRGPHSDDDDDAAVM